MLSARTCSAVFASGLLPDVAQWLCACVFACSEEASKQPPLTADGKKAYVPSDTYRMVLEMDGKEPPDDAAAAKPRQSPFNPLGGKYGSALRGAAGDDEYKADDPNSPLYKPTESAAYKAAQPVLKNPTRTGPFPTPPQPAYRPAQLPPKQPEPTIVGAAYPDAATAAGDTLVVQQSRSTITIPSKPAVAAAPAANSSGSAYVPKGPKPFSATPTE